MSGNSEETPQGVQSSYAELDETNNNNNKYDEIEEPENVVSNKTQDHNQTDTTNNNDISTDDYYEIGDDVITTQKDKPQESTKTKTRHDSHSVSRSSSVASNNNNKHTSKSRNSNKPNTDTSIKTTKLEPIKCPSMDDKNGNSAMNRQSTTTKSTKSRTPQSSTALPAVKRQSNTNNHNKNNQQDSSRQTGKGEKTRSSSPPVAAAAVSDLNNGNRNGNFYPAVDIYLSPDASGTETNRKRQHKHKHGQYPQGTNSNSNHRQRREKQQQQMRNTSRVENTEDGDWKTHDRAEDHHTRESVEYVALLNYYDELYKGDSSIAKLRKILSSEDMTRMKETKSGRNSKRGYYNQQQEKEKEGKEQQNHENENNDNTPTTTMGKDVDGKRKWVPVSRGANHLTTMSSVSLQSNKRDPQTFNGTERKEEVNNDSSPEKQQEEEIKEEKRTVRESSKPHEQCRSKRHLPTPRGQYTSRPHDVYQRCLQQLLGRSNSGNDTTATTTTMQLSYSYSCILSKASMRYTSSPTPPLQKRDGGEHAHSSETTLERIYGVTPNGKRGNPSFSSSLPAANNTRESKRRKEQQQQQEQNQEEKKEKEQAQGSEKEKEKQQEKKEKEHQKKEESQEGGHAAFRELEYIPIHHGTSDENSLNSAHSLRAEEEQEHNDEGAPQELFV